MRDAELVRTTLTLDDDILEAARKLSEARGVPIGVIISELARRALAPSTPSAVRNGIRLFPVREAAGIVTAEMVSELLEETD